MGRKEVTARLRLQLYFFYGLALTFLVTRANYGVLSSFVLRKKTTDLAASSITTAATKTVESPRTVSIPWNKQGCQQWPGPIPHEQVMENVLRDPPPTAIAVTLAKGVWAESKRQFEMVCNKVPTQLAYFLEPHGIDLLILLEMKGYTMDQVASCMKLQPQPPLTTAASSWQTWHNLDGSNLTTRKYRSETGKSRVYLADYTMPYPSYIVKNMSYLDEKKGCMKRCSSNYVQATRFYSDKVLHLGILNEYDYWLKIDTDVGFHRTIPFNLLHDMKIRGALFAHTAQIEGGDAQCSTGAREAVDDFIDLASGAAANASNFDSGGRGVRPEWATLANWKAPCSAGVPMFERVRDEYYSNFVIGNVRFWQSEPVRHFGQWLNEYEPGFFRYRWTDQIFYHVALGLFVGPDFQSFVADYTELRCSPNLNCWYHWRWNGASPPCVNGGYFSHDKTVVPWKGIAALNLTALPINDLHRAETPHESKYVPNCTGLA